LNKASRDALYASCRNFATNILNQSPRKNATPPCLDRDSGSSKLLVSLDRHASAHVLLYNSDQRIKPVGTEGLEGGQHASSKENLGQTILVLVRIIDSFLKDERTQRLELQI